MINITVFLRCAIPFFCVAAFFTARYAVAVPAEFEFKLHPQADVLYRSEEEVNEYIIALGKYKKSGNRWLPEKQLRKQGKLTRYTMELPKHYLEQESFDFYRQQLPHQVTQLFFCESRACGESNNWANDHFSIKQLYGTNASQHYVVFRVPTSTSLNTESYVTIYTVRRGNRRLYTQLDVLSITP